MEMEGNKEGVGEVIEEGDRMIYEGGIYRDEEDEVSVKMRIMNYRWEDISIKDMERKDRINEKIMDIKKKKMDKLRKWLKENEERI
jgi:hypothetical protein